MNGHLSVRHLKAAAPLAIGAAMVMAVGSASAQVRPYAKDQAQAEAKRDVKRINRIINGLTPQRHHNGRSPIYRKKVRKIITYRKGRKGGRSYYVNFNHSVDLSVYFRFNSSRIQPAARPVLDDLGSALTSPRLRFARYLIAGHTDAQGARGYNQWLSEQRAQAVVDYLVQRFGIHPGRLVALGFGEERPVNRRKPYAAQNRRVEVSLLENDTAHIRENTETFKLRKYKFTPLRQGGVR